MHKSVGMLPQGGRLSLMEKLNNKEEKVIMSKIVNEAKIKNPFIAKIRELLEHRAFWLYLLVDEAEKRGLDPTDFASAAISRCGISQGNDLVKKGGTKSLKGLKKTLFTKAARWVFEMDVVESTDVSVYQKDRGAGVPLCGSGTFHSPGGNGCKTVYRHFRCGNPLCAH